VFTEENRNSQISQNSENSFSPDNELEVSKIVKKLYQENLPVEIIGSGSKRRIGKKLKCKKILDLSKLSGVIEYLPEELYIKVKACTPIAEIEVLLKKHNQELAFEPLDLATQWQVVGVFVHDNLGHQAIGIFGAFLGKGGCWLCQYTLFRTP